MNWVRLLELAFLMGWNVSAGWAPHYDPGVMARVVANRGLAPAACNVSSPTMGISSWVYVYGVNTGALRYCRVADVSEAIDRARHIRTGRIVEVSHTGATVFCGTTTEPVVQCPVVVISEY